MLDARGIRDGLESHARTLGVFDQIGTHEPKNAPGRGISLAFWFDALAPAPRGSGLAATSALLVVNARLTVSMLREPQDDIDVDITDALAALFTAYSGDFTLGGLIRNIDLLGQTGTALSAKAGYLEQDSAEYRAWVATIPAIVNDVFEQEP